MLSSMVLLKRSVTMSARPNHLLVMHHPLKGSEMSGRKYKAAMVYATEMLLIQNNNETCMLLTHIVIHHITSTHKHAQGQ